MNKKTIVFLIISIIIICIGIISIFCTKKQNENVIINQTENNTNQLEQTQKDEIDLNNNNLKTKDYGIITNIENNTITIKNEELIQIKINENTKITNYRTAENMNLADMKIGDYYKSGEVIRNISGEEWKKECIKNLAYCYKEGNLICNPQEITDIQNMGNYVIITLIMEDSTTEYFSGKDSGNNTFELKVIAYSNLNIPTSSGGVTVYNLKEEVIGFMFWIGLDKETINNKYPVISDIEIYDK